MPIEFLKRFRFSVILLLLVLVSGTFGYMFLGDEKTVIDGFYRTINTILTIGRGNPDIQTETKIFTIIIALAGVGTGTYVLSSITAAIVEGYLKETYKKRQIKKIINKMENHYIVCGSGRVGLEVANELYSTKREFVIVEKNQGKIDEMEKKYKGVPVIFGDADNEDTLISAGIKTAAGLFATTADDNQNLVISLTAKYICPNVRVIARCLESDNMNKIKKAGADSVITESTIAGMRIVSEMVRPASVTFLDKMRNDSEKNLRVEEIPVHECHCGKKIAELQLERFPNSLLIAVVSESEEWLFIPAKEVVIGQNNKLVIITNPDERVKLCEMISNS